MPADAPRGTVSCGDLRREPDGRWFFGSTYLGRDGERRALMVDGVGDCAGVVGRHGSPGAQHRRGQVWLPRSGVSMRK